MQFVSKGSTMWGNALDAILESFHANLWTNHDNLIRDITCETIQILLFKQKLGTVECYQHYLHGSGFLGSEKPVVVRIHMLKKWNAQTFLRKAKFHTEKEMKGTSVAQWLACLYCTTEGLGSNLGTDSIFSERPLERFSNRILSCTKSTPPSYGDLSSKNLRNRTMPVNGNKQWQHQQWSQ
jgi:hypothetical protein